MDPASGMENARGRPGGRQRRGARFPHRCGRRTQRAAHRLHRPSSSSCTNTTTSRISKTRDDRDGRRLTDTRIGVHDPRNPCSTSAEYAYVSSSASEPNHCTLTTVTRPSDRMPRTAALAWRSSSFMRCSWSPFIFDNPMRSLEESTPWPEAVPISTCHHPDNHVPSVWLFGMWSHSMPNQAPCSPTNVNGIRTPGPSSPSGSVAASL